MTKRIPKDQALELLFADGKNVKIEGHVVGLNGPTNEQITGRLAVSPELLGWTLADLLNPEITE